MVHTYKYPIFPTNHKKKKILFVEMKFYISILFVMAVSNYVFSQNLTQGPALKKGG